MFLLLSKKSKNFFTPINVVFLVHLSTLLFVILGIFPRESMLFVAGILVYFFLFSRLEEGTMYVARSIPFFVALPFAETFDSFNMWRIATFILFVKWFLPYLTRENLKTYIAKEKIIAWVRNHQFEGLAILLFVWMVFSVTAAHDVFASIKRVIYFANLAMFYPVVLAVIQKKETLERFFKNVCIALVLLLLVGYFQLWLTYQWDFMRFAAFWTKNMQLNFYGTNWSNIVYHSNTWFAYLGGEGLRLRVFSTFPDSHSFPLFLILGFSMAAALFWKNIWGNRFAFLWLRLRGFFRRSSEVHRETFRGLLKSFFFVLLLLMIILTGTRGIWLSVGFPVLATFLAFVRFKDERRIVLAGGALLLVFLLLIPLASYIFSFPQFTGGVSLERAEREAFFERLKSSFNPEETSNEGRLFIWKETIGSLLKNPILGVGVGNFPVVLGQDVSFAKAGSSAHNLYLNVAAEMGIPALIILFITFGLILRLCLAVFLGAGDLFIKSFSWFSVLSFLWVLGYSLTDAALLDERAFLMFITFLGAIKGAERLATT